MLVEKVVDWLCTMSWTTCRLSTRRRAVCPSTAKAVDSCPQVCRWLHACFTQVLRIEFVSNVINLFTDIDANEHFLTNFVNRMNGGSVVFATKLLGDFWKAHLELAP